MTVIQWIAGIIIVFTLIIVAVGVLFPKAERTTVITTFTGILGFLLGAGLQEFRVQQQIEGASEARAEATEAREEANEAKQVAFESYARLQEGMQLITQRPVTNNRVIVPQGTVEELRRLSRERPPLFRAQ